MKSKRIRKIVIGLGTLPLLLCGCDEQETISRFNRNGTEIVDNISDTEEDVDNISDTEEDVDDVSGGVSEECISDETETREPVSTVLLVMVGDILFHTPVAESGVQENGSYNYDALFMNVKDEITAADVALVNQEVIIGGEELGISGYPSFNAPYELGDALTAAGFDVVLHATNHALDQGKKGVKNCLSYWERNHPEMAVLGINQSQAAQDEIYVYEQDGIRIAILNYTYGTNGIEMPSVMPYAVDMLEEGKVVADIRAAEEMADFTIVCPHWGTEYQLTPSAEQERWTQIFLQNGVDLVIGTHPHVIEPITWFTYDSADSKSTDSNDESGKGSGIAQGSNTDGMLVYYSLGNFVNWTASSGEGISNRMVGGMACVTIGKDASGDVFIADYGIKPLVCHLTEGTNGVTTYFLSDYTEELAKENAIVQQDSAFSKEYCENLCNEVWQGQQIN